MAQSGAAPLTRELILQDVDVGTCGALLPNLIVKICEPFDSLSGDDTTTTTRELKLGEVGERHVKGPNVFKGYHGNPKATDECLSPDGWFRTGDMGHINERGNLFITDRVKELIKYNGFQVPPAELEGYLIDFLGVIGCAVVSCAVVGIYNKELATLVQRAYVVTGDASKPLDTNELQKWFSNCVANHKKLRGGIRLVEEIPKNASRKILRKDLKAMARAEFEAKGAKL